MSWRSRWLAGAAALGALGAISAATLAISVVGAGGTAELARASVLAAAPAAVALPEPGPATPVTYQVSPAAQRRTLDYWTARRMLIAASRAPRVSAPKGIPSAAPFNGSPTTGALFYTTGRKPRFCTAAVVDSSAGDLVLTAAHCVDGKKFANHIAYVPDYNGGKLRYGEWPVRAITVASGWEHAHNPDLDLAFLTVGPLNGKRIQSLTGGLALGFNQGYDEKIEAVAYDDAEDKPVRCPTKSFMFRTGQMEFLCNGFASGTSGAPWILDYNPKNGGGTMFGLIGGYEGGGRYEWASHSPYFGAAARALYRRAEAVPLTSAAESVTRAYRPPSSFFR